MDAKCWLTGQNWVDQYQRNCAGDGHTDTIRHLTDMVSVHDFLNDCERSFRNQPEPDTVWVQRLQKAKYATSYILIK